MISGSDPTIGPPALDGLPSDPEASYRPPSKAGVTGRAFDPTVVLGLPDEAAVPTEPPSGSSPEPTSRAGAAGASAYLLRREVGAGTFGEIWEAVQITLKRVVAVKRPKPPLPEADPEDSRQAQLEFLKEALTAGQLDHPNVVPVYDLGSDEQGCPLLAMKLVEGTRWDELISSEERSGHDFYVRHISILVKVSKAVAFAHSRGVIHRDLKPQQVMVGDFGEVFLMDWGLAVGLPEVEPQRPGSEFVTPVAEATNPAGTAAFMAPEQTEATTERIGVRTDIYLLGGMLYYILTGSPPHASANSWEAFRNAARGIVEPPEARAPENGIPPDLSAICMRALAADPQLRPGSALELIEALESWLSGSAARTESRALAARAAAKMQPTGGASYAVLEETDSLLAQALLLWPENPEAGELHRRVLEEYTRLALANGDLTLAAAQAERIPDEGARAHLLAKVSAAMRRAEAQARQLRLAAYGAFALVIVATFLGLLIARSSAEALVAESRNMAEAADLNMARVLDDQKRRYEERNAALFQKISDLQVMMAELIDLAGREARPPESLEAKDDWSAVWLASRPDIRARLQSSLAQLDQKRNVLAAEGEWVEPVPPEINFARGVLALAEGGTTAPGEAYRHFAQAAEQMPHRNEPHAGMGVAAARMDALTSATEHFTHAVQRARFNDTLAHHRAASLLHRAVRRLWKEGGLEKDDLLVEASPGGQNTELYREVSGSWADSAHSANYKSVAPGLSPQERCGTRRLLFYEPFRRVASNVPARARFSPSFTEPRRCHVYVTWPAEANASPVYYTVRHSGGEQVIALGQNGLGIGGEGNANAWIVLGEFEFSPGTDQYVEVAVGDDVRPMAAERYGQVSVDAVLFAAAPLRSGVRLPPVAQNAGADGPVLCGETPAGEEALKWLASPDEALSAAIRLKKPLFLYCHQPADSCFIHPLNQNRDYCENRLLCHPGVEAVLKANYVAARVDLTRYPDAAARFGLHPAGASLSVVEPATSPTLRLQLRGAQLLISPAELAERLRPSGVEMPIAAGQTGNSLAPEE